MKVKNSLDNVAKERDKFRHDIRVKDIDYNTQQDYNHITHTGGTEESWNTCNGNRWATLSKWEPKEGGTSGRLAICS